MMKKRIAYIRTISGAYLCGYGLLTSNRREAKTYDSVESVKLDMQGFSDPDEMAAMCWFEGASND